MMNLVAKTPSLVSSSTSGSPGKRYCGSQYPWSSIAEEDISGRPDNSQIYLKPPTSCSKFDDDRAWSSQE